MTEPSTGVEGEAASKNEYRADLATKQPVSGESVVSFLESTLNRFLFLPEGVSLLIALWVIHTHAREAAEHFPILYVRSPEKGCGKTTLLKILAALVYKPVLAVDMSPSALYRLTNAMRPTLLLDEGDMQSLSKDYIRLLNSGHTRGPSVWRTDKVAEDLTPVEFSPWGPKAFAAIGSVLPPQTLDRSITVLLEKKPSGIELMRFKTAHAEALTLLRDQVAAWVSDNKDALNVREPVLPSGFDNRRADNWRPLLAIAEVVSPTIAERARRLAEAMASEQPETPSERQMILADLHRYFIEKDTTVCPSKDFQDWLAKLDDRPWKDFHGYNRPISTNKIAELLGAYGLVPRKSWLPDRSKQFRGYSLDAKLQQVFATYVVEPPEQTEHVDAVTVVPSVPPRKHAGTRIDLTTGRVKP